MPADESRYALIGALAAGLFGLLAKLGAASVSLWKGRNADEAQRARDARADTLNERTMALTALKERLADLHSELQDERKRNEILTDQMDALRKANLQLLRERLDP